MEFILHNYGKANNHHNIGAVSIETLINIFSKLPFTKTPLVIESALVMVDCAIIHNSLHHQDGTALSVWTTKGIYTVEITEGEILHTHSTRACMYIKPYKALNRYNEPVKIKHLQRPDHGIVQIVHLDGRDKCVGFGDLVKLFKHNIYIEILNIRRSLLSNLFRNALKREYVPITTYNPAEFILTPFEIGERNFSFEKYE